MRALVLYSRRIKAGDHAGLDAMIGGLGRRASPDGDEEWRRRKILAVVRIEDGEMRRTDPHIPADVNDESR